MSFAPESKPARGVIVAPMAALALALSAVVAVRRRRRARLPARAMIVSPRQSTIMAPDGSVHSVQSAELLVPQSEIDRLWTPFNLENLARTYWRFLSRVTLGLIKVVYGEDERSVTLLGKRLTLLRFEAPEYEFAADRGTVRWPIRDGLLVARAGRGCGFLALDVRREREPDEQGATKIYIQVEVANFYPAIAAGFSVPAYSATQSVLHVLVTHAFLRSLAALNLADSRVRRFSDQP